MNAQFTLKFAFPNEINYLLLKMSTAINKKNKKVAVSRVVDAPDSNTAAKPAKNKKEDIREAVNRLKKQRIVDTAVELFHEYGMSKTTLEAVAIKMNVTKPFIYSYFNSKNELLSEICSNGIRASLEVIDGVLKSGLGPKEKVEKLIYDFMLTVIENQGYLAVYSREEKSLTAQSRKKINTMRREFDKKFTSLLEDGVKAGQFVIEDVALTSLSIDGIISWSYVWYRPNGRLSPQETAQHITRLVMRMISA